MTNTMDSETKLALVDIMESRANVYRVLSRCFKEEIDSAFANELAESFRFESEDESLAQKLSAMQNLLANVDDDALEQLAVDFDRIFFGMGPITARHAFPYESVYTSEKGIMMQDAYAQVVRAYRDQHLAKDSSFTEPEDHIAVELAFMATLSDRTVSFLQEGLEDAATETVIQQLSFAKTHLQNWIDRFCMDLQKADEQGFYGALAEFTLAFVEDDVQLLAEMVD